MLFYNDLASILWSSLVAGILLIWNMSWNPRVHVSLYSERSMANWNKLTDGDYCNFALVTVLRIVLCIMYWISTGIWCSVSKAFKVWIDTDKTINWFKVLCHNSEQSYCKCRHVHVLSVHREDTLPPFRLLMTFPQMNIYLWRYKANIATRRSLFLITAP